MSSIKAEPPIKDQSVNNTSPSEYADARFKFHKARATGTLSSENEGSEEWCKTGTR